eukprot:80828-Pelagomonas_calceolata.AAC.3
MSDSQRHALWPTQQYAARLQLRVHVQVGNVVTKVLGVNLHVQTKTDTGGCMCKGGNVVTKVLVINLHVQIKTDTDGCISMKAMLSPRCLASAYMCKQTPTNTDRRMDLKRVRVSVIACTNRASKKQVEKSEWLLACTSNIPALKKDGCPLPSIAVIIALPSPSFKALTSLLARGPF